MIQEVNAEEVRKQTSGNISSGSKHKRRWQSGGKNEAPKRAKLAPDNDLVGGIKQAAELEADKGADSSLIICFDLELADGSFASEIFQIGAVGGKKGFNSYILPRGVIDWGVTRFVNGIKVVGKGGGRRLVDKDRHMIASHGLKEGLELFLAWIEQEKREGGYTSAILVSHGSTDMPALLNNIAREGLEERFNDSVQHFVDSLSYFQQFHGVWGNHGMASLSERLLPGEDFKPHDAGEDARILHLCLRAAAGSLLLPRLLTKAITVEQAWLRAATMLVKTLKKNEKRKNKTAAILFNAIK